MIGAVGDVLLHSPLQNQGYRYGFETLWAGLLPFMQKPDMMYANLEGPAAAGINKSGRSVRDPGLVFDDNVYSGYPAFNYNPIIIKDLKDSGVDILSTANNHSMDRRTVGIRSTMDALDSYNMPYFGSRQNAHEAFYKITQKGGWKIGWVACTYSTNGIPDPEDLVLDCFDGRVSAIIAGIKNSVDAVIVTPHWGDEYQTSPNSQQKRYAKQWLEDGAHAIIGAHPHVTQPWEKYTTADGREGLILYSLGNFVSNQTPLVRQSSIMLFVGLTKQGGKTWVNGVRYLPLYMQRRPHYEALASNFVSDSNSDVRSSLRLMTNMFGEERIVEPGEQVITNAECN